MELSGLCPHSCLTASKFSYYLKKHEQGSLNGPSRFSSWHGCWSFEVRGSQNPAVHLCSPRGTGLGTRSSAGVGLHPATGLAMPAPRGGHPLDAHAHQGILAVSPDPCLLASQPASLHPCSALRRQCILHRAQHRLGAVQDFHICRCSITKAASP